MWPLQAAVVFSSARFAMLCTFPRSNPVMDSFKTTVTRVKLSLFFHRQISLLCWKTYFKENMSIPRSSKKTLGNIIMRVHLHRSVFNNSSLIGREGDPYSFIIHEQVYYRSFPLFPSNPSYKPTYSQLYIVDVHEVLDNRMTLSANQIALDI